MSKYCFGIDVGGTSIKCGLFRTDGTLIDKWEIPTRTEEAGSKILPDIAATIKEKMDEKQLLKTDVEGVGIGIPGPVNSKGEVPVAVNLYWGYKPVAKEMEELTGLVSKAGNDANVAALGENWKGAAAGASSAVMVTLGTGVGGGIILNEKIITGFNGAAGELGHANMNHEETDSCNCGNQGCLEQYASATGIVRVAKMELNASAKDSVLRNLDTLTAKDVLDAYKSGDELAVDIIEEVCDKLGGALAMCSCVVDPEVFVVGGGVSRAGQPLIDCIKKYYRKYAFKPSKNTEIVLATLGNDAGIYGAARMVLE